MGFMDKVKSAAQDVASQAQKATSQAQSKLEQSQLRKKADDVARNLGYAVVRQRTQGVDAAADIDAMVDDIVGIETQIAEQEEVARQAAEQASYQNPPPGQYPPAQPTSAPDSPPTQYPPVAPMPGQASPPAAQPPSQPGPDDRPQG